MPTSSIERENYLEVSANNTRYRPGLRSQESTHVKLFRLTCETCRLSGLLATLGVITPRRGINPEIATDTRSLVIRLGAFLLSGTSSKSKMPLRDLSMQAFFYLPTLQETLNDSRSNAEGLARMLLLAPQFVATIALCLQASAALLVSAPPGSGKLVCVHRL